MNPSKARFLDTLESEVIKQFNLPPHTIRANANLSTLMRYVFCYLAQKMMSIHFRTSLRFLNHSHELKILQRHQRTLDPILEHFSFLRHCLQDIEFQTRMTLWQQRFKRQPRLPIPPPERIRD